MASLFFCLSLLPPQKEGTFPGPSSVLLSPSYYCHFSHQGASHSLVPLLVFPSAFLYLLLGLQSFLNGWSLLSTHHFISCDSTPTTESPHYLLLLHVVAPCQCSVLLTTWQVPLPKTAPPRTHFSDFFCLFSITVCHLLIHFLFPP